MDWMKIYKEWNACLCLARSSLPCRYGMYGRVYTNVILIHCTALRLSLPLWGAQSVLQIHRMKTHKCKGCYGFMRKGNKCFIVIASLIVAAIFLRVHMYSSASVYKIWKLFLCCFSSLIRSLWRNDVSKGT